MHTLSWCLPVLRRFCFLGAVWGLASLACISQCSAQAYPYVGNYPIPMQPANQQGITIFPYQDPVSAAPYNADGTNSYYPITSAGTQTVSNVTYNLQKLSISDPKYGSDSINFKGQSYTVYSAVPQTATIASAYSNCSQFYSQAAITGNIDSPFLPTIKSTTAIPRLWPPPPRFLLIPMGTFT